MGVEEGAKDDVVALLVWLSICPYAVVKSKGSESELHGTDISGS